MANAHSTLASLFTDIAKAIRSKTGGTASIVADNFPTAISSIEVKENLDSELATQDSLIAQINTALTGKAGVALPVLSNPAGTGNIEAGYQAIDGSGKLIEGDMVKGVLPVSGNATYVASNKMKCAGVYGKSYIHIYIAQTTSTIGQMTQFWVVNGKGYGLGNSYASSKSNMTVSIATDGTITVSGTTSDIQFKSGITYRFDAW